MLLPQEHTVMVRQTSKWAQVFVLALVGMGATAFTVAWFYRLDEVITVQGRLVPAKGGVEVKSPFNGKLESVMIENNKLVEKGQVLLEFDVSLSKSQEDTLTRQLKLEEKKLIDQLTSNTKRMETLVRNINLNNKILSKLTPLENNGAISELQLLQQENQIETQKDELIQLENARNQLTNASNSKIEELTGRLNEIKNKLANKAVKAPISGIVFDLKPDNNRYVVTNAEALMKIVPTGNLSAEVNVSNQDIGFIKTNQKVKVRVDSFPFTEYGELDGVINSIGADALPPDNLIQTYHFPVNILLNSSFLQTREKIKIPLQSGMTITTNVKLRDRRLIELLSDMFTNRGESLKRLRQP